MWRGGIGRGSGRGWGWGRGRRGNVVVAVGAMEMFYILILSWVCFTLIYLSLLVSRE